MKYITSILLLAFLIVPATIAQEDDTEEVIFNVGPYTQPCVGVAPQDCLIISTEDDPSLSFFYDSIEGFDYEPGKQYTLRVAITERENVPADASSLQYELVEVISEYSADITGKIWELQSFNGETIEDPTRYNIIFLEDGVSIKADCNQVGANVEFEPFSLETTFSTMAMCAPDSLEADYIAALNAVTLISVEQGTLVLQSSEGQLRFAPPSLVDTAWTMQSNTVGNEILEFDPGVVYSIEFTPDFARMILSCNNAGGEFTVDGGLLTFDEIEREEELCEDDPLYPIFPPAESLYHITDTGLLVITASTGGFYTFTPSE